MKNIFLFIITPLFLLGISFLFIYIDNTNVVLPILTFLLFMLNMLLIIRQKRLRILKRMVLLGKNPFSNIYTISSLIILSVSVFIGIIRESGTSWNGISMPIFFGVCFFLVSCAFYTDYLISFRNKKIVIANNLYNNRLNYSDIKEVIIKDKSIVIKKMNDTVLSVEIQLNRDDIYMLTSFLKVKNVSVFDNCGKND